MADQLVTPRLILRRLVIGDTATLLPLFNDWRLIEWLSAPPWPYTEADMRSYFGALLASTVPDREIFRVIEREGKAVGGISWRLRQASHLQAGDGPNLGYWLAYQHWGQGYMTEAATGVIEHLFTTPAVNAVYSGAFEGNTASLHVQDKLGFVRDGVTTLRSNPKQRDLPHTNTVLTRARFGIRLETLKRTSHALS
jgi:RimJ/RimL family protein N-acetyltransferase